MNKKQLKIVTGVAIAVLIVSIIPVFGLDNIYILFRMTMSLEQKPTRYGMPRIL